MTTPMNDLGGGHSPRELDPRTGTFTNDYSAPVPQRGLAFPRSLRGTSVTRALIGVGVLLLAWTVRGRWPGISRRFRRRRSLWA